MSVFPKQNPKESVSNAEETILDYWKDNSIFQKTIDSRSDKNTFRFFDGPPFATGTPHYGHILAGTIKDTIPRYFTMKGYKIPRKWGWDCHGVPVEYQVEKEYKIGGKPGIEEMGIGKFNELCRSVVMRCSDQWETTVDRMGRFVDFSDDYKTMDPEFMESVWWVFAQLWKRGLIYKGEKVIAYSPKLGSPLSNFEAGLNYKDIDDPAITVKFKLKDEDIFVLAWTTTPWTLPTNLALAVNPKLQYAVVEKDNIKYIVAENLVEKVFKEDFVIDKKIIGKDLVGKNYEPLFPFYKEAKGAFRILGADFVSSEDGTGIVHTAPNFGEDDSRVCFENGIKPIEQPIDENGFFNEIIPELKGKYFRADNLANNDSVANNANDWVLNKLKETGQIFHRAQIRHSYPHCWRTDCALMYRGIFTWFVDIQKLKKQLLNKNEDISWVPEYLKYGRFGKGLETAPDWAISRNRYWGTPIPVWQCDKTGEFQVITSREELSKLSGQEVDDIHRHFIDDLTWKNEKTGGTMRRIEEVLDCWFESGSMPYASNHYPFKEKPIRDFQNEMYFMRHGVSLANVNHIVSSDIENSKKYPLTEKGIEETQVMSERLTDFDVIISSPLLRTRQTAEIMAKSSGVEVQIDDRLRESDMGDFDGKPYSAVWEYLEKNNLKNKPYPGGESLIENRARVEEFLKEINQKYKGKKILIVSHGLTIQTGLEWAKGEEPKQFEKKIKNSFIYPILPYKDFESADFIAEGLDQTRCWFYNLHVLGVALFGDKIFKNVVTNGIVLTEDGTKMSKSKKNYPDPKIVFDKYGADAIRFYLLDSPVARGENLKFAERGVSEVLKSVILPLKSAYQFFSTYANIDEWKPTKFLAIRHGQAEHNLQRIYCSSVNTVSNLTKEGQSQIKEVSKTIEKFDILITSPLARAKQTAQILKEETGFSGEIIEDERIIETQFGDLEGKPLIPHKERMKNPTTERTESVQKRMMEFYQEMSDKYPGKTIAFVSHVSSIKYFEGFLNNQKGDHEDNKLIPSLWNGGYKIFFAEVNPKTELDEWILSVLQSTIAEYRKNFDAYKIEGALKLIPDFVDKLNNWYLRRSRRRFWANGLNEEKRSGYETLHTVLYQLSKLLAPICPFLAEKLYQDLGGSESVHLEYFPGVKTELLHSEVEKQIKFAREIVRLSAGIRAESKIKLRQPLKKLRFLVTESVDIDLNIIKEEANVKEVEILQSVEGIATKIIRVNAKLVGRKFGKKVQELIKDGKEGKFEELENGAVKIAGEILQSNEYEIGFITQEGVEASSTKKCVVLLDTEITEDLEVEGYARDIVRMIQEKRKSQGFEVADRIIVRYHTGDVLLQKAFNDYEDFILKEVLGDEKIQEEGLSEESIELNGKELVLIVEKV